MAAVHTWHRPLCTGERYGAGLSEQRVGKALAGAHSPALNSFSCRGGTCIHELPVRHYKGAACVASGMLARYPSCSSRGASSSINEGGPPLGRIKSSQLVPTVSCMVSRGFIVTKKESSAYGARVESCYVPGQALHVPPVHRLDSDSQGL